MNSKTGGTEKGVLKKRGCGLLHPDALCEGGAGETHGTLSSGAWLEDRDWMSRKV